MNNLLSAEQILFACLSDLSKKNEHADLSVMREINQVVLCAMHKHSTQYLLPLKKLLTEVGITLRQPELLKVAEAIETINSYLRGSERYLSLA